MQQERQLRRRHTSSATGNHVTRGRLKIRSPALPLNKWEPPPYQLRETPTDDGDVIRRPSRVVGDHDAAQTANHCDTRSANPLASETDKPADHSHHPRVSVVDTSGVVVHRAFKGSGRRQPRSDDAVAAAACRTTRKAAPPAVPRRRDRPPRRPPRDSEPPTNAANPPPPFSAVAQDSIVVPFVCNYVDPAPIKHDENPPSPPPDVKQDDHHLLVPPSAAAEGTPVAATTSSGVEIGSAVVNEVREVKRMLRSFMAKLNQRDVRERHAFEWRIVALALDRLFFILYIIIIFFALMLLVVRPKFVETSGAK